MEENKYIQLLKWGREKGEVTEEELIAKLNEFNFPSGNASVQTTLNFFTKDVFFRAGDKHILTFEAIFELNEHERLEEARIESKKAMKLATRSIILTGIALVASIIIGIWQITKM